MRGRSSIRDDPSISYTCASDLKLNDLILVVERFNNPRSCIITSIDPVEITSPTEEQTLKIWHRTRLWNLEAITVKADEMVMIPKVMPRVGEIGAQTYQVRVDTLTKNGWIVLKGCPCTITAIDISGCFCGGGNFHIHAVDLWSGRKVEELVRRSATMVDVPVVEKEQMLVLNLTEEGRLDLRGETSGERKDVEIRGKNAPEEIRSAWGAAQENGEDVSVDFIRALGVEAVVGLHKSNSSTKVDKAQAQTLAE